MLSPIDLADARELRVSEPPDLDVFLHSPTIADRPVVLSPYSRCAS
jgi:hypothetical protein